MTLAHHKNAEGMCPTCDQKMVIQSPRHYFCQNCNQHYDEEYYCPMCEQRLDQIKGCGTVNYLCRKDGLISSSKVKFCYQARQGD